MLWEPFCSAFEEKMAGEQSSLQGLKSIFYRDIKEGGISKSQKLTNTKRAEKRLFPGTSSPAQHKSLYKKGK